MSRVTVVIPTKDRPDKLARCLAAVEAARARLPCEVLVVDGSTDPEKRQMVTEICRRRGSVRLVFHSGRNVAGARNACAAAAHTELLINVDDDIRIEPGSLERLLARYDAAAGPRVVAGSVAWDGRWSKPLVMHPYGYGRPANPGEDPSFLIGAFFLYSRELALRWPWNESIRTSDDRFMGALWRSRGVQMMFEPEARALHDPEHVRYDAREARSHIYANLFDSVLANPNLPRALSYEFAGFAVQFKKFSRRPWTLPQFLRAWASGHVAFIHDIRRLRNLLNR